MVRRQVPLEAYMVRRQAPGRRERVWRVVRIASWHHLPFYLT